MGNHDDVVHFFCNPIQPFFTKANQVEATIQWIKLDSLSGIEVYGLDKIVAGLVVVNRAT